MTMQGFQSLTSTSDPTVNTFPKNLTQLLASLSSDKRTVLTAAILGLPIPRSQHIQKATMILAALSDEQYHVLVGMFEVSEPARMAKYLEILCTPSISPKAADHKPMQCSESFSSILELDETWSKRNETVSATDLKMRILALPIELQCIIGDKFCEAAFRPGFLFPQQLPNSRGNYTLDGTLYGAPNVKALYALDGDLHHYFHDIYYSDNTWVIGKGSPEDTVEFLSWMNDEEKTLIHMARIAFTLDDLVGGNEILLSIQSRIASSSSGQTIDNLRVLEQFENECGVFVTQLTAIWMSKFFSLALLNLTHLTLDLRQAYRPDDCFIGAEFFTTLTNFHYGLPATLVILAPTKELEDETRRAIEGTNSF